MEEKKKMAHSYKKVRNGDSDASFQLQNLANIHLVTADGNNLSLRMLRWQIL